MSPARLQQPREVGSLAVCAIVETTLGLHLAAGAPFAKTITYLKAVGPLSGKAIIAVAIWLVSWIVLALIMRGRNPGVKTALTVSGLLIAVGFVGTFPLFYDLFKP